MNAAKGAIQTYKDAFIAALATTDRDFPIQLRDKLAPQVQDTLNLLRASRTFVGHLYSIQYKSIFGTPNKVRCNMCEEARPSRLDFQREEVKTHHIIASTQDCWS